MHLIFHRTEYRPPSTAPVKGKDPREKLADAVAGAILLPRTVIEEELGFYRNRWIPEPVLLDTLEPNVEAIASLNPDVILDTRSDNSQERHDLLEPIAPVVGPPPGVEVTYGTTWQQQTRQVAQVVGEEERGEELVTELEDRFEQIREENPEFADLTIAVGAYFDGQYGAYVPGDTRADVLAELGFEYKPELVEMADGSFYADLSSELVEELDADLTVVFPIGDVVETLNEDPVLRGIGSAEDGRLIIGINEWQHFGRDLDGDGLTNHTIVGEVDLRSGSVTHFAHGGYAADYFGPHIYGYAVEYSTGRDLNGDADTDDDVWFAIHITAAAGTPL